MHGTPMMGFALIMVIVFMIVVSSPELLGIVVVCGNGAIVIMGSIYLISAKLKKRKNKKGRE